MKMKATLRARSESESETSSSLGIEPLLGIVPRCCCGFILAAILATVAALPANAGSAQLSLEGMSGVIVDEDLHEFLSSRPPDATLVGTGSYVGPQRSIRAYSVDAIWL